MRVTRTLTVTWILVILLLHGCSVTGQRQHPDFDEQRKFVERVAIIPPTVDIELITFTGENEKLVERENNMVKYLDETARKILNQRGYEVCETQFSELTDTDPDLAFQVEQLKTAYTEVSRDLYTGQTVSEEDYKKFDVTVGPVVNHFSEIADADALLMMSFKGIVKSEGQMRKEIAANILLGALTGSYAQPISEASAIEVALLDGNTGDILWTNVNSDAAVSSSVLRGALEKIPLREMPEEPAVVPEETDATGAEAGETRSD